MSLSEEELNEALQEGEQLESNEKHPAFPFEDPENWEDHTGEVVIGQPEKLILSTQIEKLQSDVLELKVLKSNFDLDDDYVSIYLNQILRNELRNQNIKEKDTIMIKYHGRRESHGPNDYYHNYTLKVLERSDKGDKLYSEADIPF